MLFKCFMCINIGELPFCGKTKGYKREKKEMYKQTRKSLGLHTVLRDKHYFVLQVVDKINSLVILRLVIVSISLKTERKRKCV